MTGQERQPGAELWARPAGAEVCVCRALRERWLRREPAGRISSKHCVAYSAPVSKPPSQEWIWLLWQISKEMCPSPPAPPTLLQARKKDHCYYLRTGPTRPGQVCLQTAILGQTFPSGKNPYNFRSWLLCLASTWTQSYWKEDSSMRSKSQGHLQGRCKSG